MLCLSPLQRNGCVLFFLIFTSAEVRFSRTLGDGAEWCSVVKQTSVFVCLLIFLFWITPPFRFCNGLTSFCVVAISDGQGHAL